MIPGERLLRESRRAEQAGNPTRFDSIRKAIRTGLAAVEKSGQKGKIALALEWLPDGLAVKREHM